MSFSPGSMATASMIGQVGGAATSALGSYYSASTQRIAMNGQADIADINARLAESGAQSALLQGQQQVTAHTLKVGQMKSRQRAAMAANGVDLGTGSAAETLATTDIMKEIDTNTLTANAVRNAFGYRTQAVNFQNEALGKRAGASMISPAGAAFSSLLGGAGGVAKSWYSYSKAGAWDSAPAASGTGGNGGPMFNALP